MYESVNVQSDLWATHSLQVSPLEDTIRGQIAECDIRLVRFEVKVLDVWR